MGRVGISSLLLLFYPFEMNDGKCPPTETLAVGSAYQSATFSILERSKALPTLHIRISLSLDSHQLWMRPSVQLEAIQENGGWRKERAFIKIVLIAIYSLFFFQIFCSFP